MPLITFLRRLVVALALTCGAWSQASAQMRVDGLPSVVPITTVAANTVCLSKTTKDSYFAEVGANNPGAYTNGTACASGTLRFDWNSTRVLFAVPVYVADGTAAAPSITFGSATTLGLYAVSSTALGITVSGGRIAYFNGTRLNLDAGVGLTLGGDIGSPGSAIRFGSAEDLILTRDAADTLAQRNGSNAQTFRLGPSTGYLSIGSGSLITAGSGTGLTLVNAGEVRQLVYKFTVASTAFVCAAATCDVTVGTLPAKTFVSHTLADLTTTFACTATCTTATLSATLGKTAGGNEYLLAFDADAAAAQFGDTAAELGASLTPATVQTLEGDLASWTATTAVVMRLTSAVGNIGDGAVSNLSQGTVTFYLTTTKKP